jgi:hypothetical protein
MVFLPINHVSSICNIAIFYTWWILLRRCPCIDSRYILLSVQMQSYSLIGSGLNKFLVFKWIASCNYESLWKCFNKKRWYLWRFYVLINGSSCPDLPPPPPSSSSSSMSACIVCHHLFLGWLDGRIPGFKAEEEFVESKLKLVFTENFGIQPFLCCLHCMDPRAFQSCWLSIYPPCNNLFVVPAISHRSTSHN